MKVKADKGGYAVYSNAGQILSWRYRTETEAWAQLKRLSKTDPKHHPAYSEKNEKRILA